MNSQTVFQTKIDNAITSNALRRVLASMIPREKSPICDWVEENVDLSASATSATDGNIQLYPYQREPLAETENPDTREVTLSWGQRLGKSTIWRMSLLKRVADGGLSGLIVYPNLDMGKKTNKDEVQPLLMTLPEVRKDLAIRGGMMRDSFHIPSKDSVVYFLGGGSQVISYTANWCVLDETDFVKLAKADAEDENMSQLKAIRLRMQTYRERMLIVCSSPSIYSGTIYQNWLKGSRGEWNIRCLSCGQLSPVKQLAFIRSDGSYAGLQWEKDASGAVIAESIRWICPACGHAHEYSDAFEMNRLGEYVHANPRNTAHRSYQCGALGNPHVWTWLEIAEKQEDAIDPDGKKFLANSVLGMPYKHVRQGDATASIEQTITGKKSDLPADISSRLSIVCAGVDQQKSELAGHKYYVYTVRGWDEDGNSWLLSAGIANTLDALDTHLTATYHGHRVMLAAIDQGGFDNSQDLDPFVNSHANCIYYKGTSDKTLRGRAWMPSENEAKLYLANAITYQVNLLSLLYDPPRPSGYRWNILDDAPADYIQQIMNVGPNNHIQKDMNGQAYQNWCAVGTNRRDYFDAEKMALVSLDIACHYFPPQVFARKNKPLFKRKEWLRELARNAKK